MITRRSMLRGLIATPAIVAAHNLMPIRGVIMPVKPYASGEFVLYDSARKVMVIGKCAGQFGIRMRPDLFAEGFGNVR